MRTLISQIAELCLFDPADRHLQDGYLFIEDGAIVALGAGEPPPTIKNAAEQVIRGRDRLALPGFVNTHHHFYQTLFRNVKAVQSSKLFDWLVTLYGLWQNIDEEAVYQASLVALLEMLKSGVTTTADHHYLFPPGCPGMIDAEIEAARTVGVRFHPTRGSMSLSRDEGGLPPATVVQSEDQILADCERLVAKYHDRTPRAMVRIGLAPCSPFSVTPSLMQDTRQLAEAEDLLLHTHLAETEDEVAFCQERFGRSPVNLMEEWGWLNPRTWFAHFIHLNQEDLAKAGRAGVGMSYCPSSNMRLGSGIAPIGPLQAAGVRTSIGIDGSASNDMNNMVLELRNGLLLQRLRYGADAMTPRQILSMATQQGAAVLGRSQDIGSLEIGKAADLVMFRLDTLELAGGLDDPLGALLLCDAKQVDFCMVNGEVLIRNGELQRFSADELKSIIRKQNRLSRKLIRGE